MQTKVHTNNEQQARPTEPELLRKREVATVCAVSPRMVDELRRQGLPNIHFGPRCVRYPREAVLAWLRSRTIGGTR